jgi:hypothetical protein
MELAQAFLFQVVCLLTASSSAYAPPFPLAPLFNPWLGLNGPDPIRIAPAQQAENGT